MTWIKIDDAFPNHPKVIGLSDKAFRVHISGLCYCGTYLTDGFIPMTVASKLAETEMKVIVELTNAGLWIENVKSNGFTIHDYLAHQSSKTQVQAHKEANKTRGERYREKKAGKTEANAVSHALVTPPDTDTDTDIDTDTDTEQKINTSYGEVAVPLPRIKSAQAAVTRISDKLTTARANGINAWNLSKLIEDEWDNLHNSNDIGGCIALTAWYVSELQSRKLTSVEISRIGQMTKRFGRIALLAIDEAASKDLTDLVSYAFRIAQNKYKEKVGA